jgi:chondroitin AC lyase
MYLPVKITKVFVLLLCILSCGVSSYSQGKSDDAAIAAIKKKCVQLLLSDAAYSTERSFRLTDDIKYKTDAAGYFKALNAEGSWNDIEYKNQTRGSWTPSWHLYRILLLNRAYAKNNNPAYLAAIHKALRFWIKNDFKCENWWHNNINVPFAYSSVILQLGSKAQPDELDFLNNVIVKRIPVNAATGQNLIWQLDNEARVALIHNDYAALTKIISRMQAVITITTAEGIQPDYSFHQHGPQMQVGNYGLSFVNTLLFWMAVTANSPIAFEKDKQQILFNYCTECLRWTIYRGAMDIPGIGRQLRFNATIKRGDNINENFKLIRSFDKNLGCKLAIDGFTNAATTSCSLAGNKSFWRSDYMIQLKKGRYQMSVKMHGPFVHRLEAINAENLKGAFINDGLALVQHSGKEYLNIEAIWNWNMLPGTTCDTTVNPGGKAAFATGNTSKFVGQVSNGAAGVCAMDYNRGGIKAHKSYFFVDDMLVALGAGIESAAPGNLVTTVDQSLHTGPSINGKNADGQRWLWHDNMAYYFPDNNEEVKTKTEYRRSTWESINTNNTADDKPSAGNVATTYISHNKNNSYAYIIQPGIGLKATRAKRHTGVKILANTPDAQAISAGNTVMVVFYHQGSITLNQTILEVDKPCILICKQTGSKLSEIWLSDPTRKEAAVGIKINKTITVVKIPGGDYAGSSIKASL